MKHLCFKHLQQLSRLFSSLLEKANVIFALEAEDQTFIGKESAKAIICIGYLHYKSVME